MTNIGCIYTCLIGKYDALLYPAVVDEDFDYICYTDQKHLLKKKNIGPWKIRPLIYTELDSTRNQRWHKILGYQYLGYYKYSIYIDSNINIFSPQIYEIAKNTDKTILIPCHNERECIYDEVAICSGLKKDTVDTLIKVQKYLDEEGMPQKYGLTENNLIFRNHTDKLVNTIMNEWWQYVATYSKRDQLSLCFILWKHNILPSNIQIPNLRLNHKNFRVYPHIGGFTPLSHIQAIRNNGYRSYQPIRTTIWIYRLLSKQTLRFLMRKMRQLAK